jgi:hypothetical protein
VSDILWLKTPTGRLSKFYESYKLMKLGSFMSLSKNEAISFAEKKLRKYAKEVYKSELKKGYKLDKVYLLWAIWD